MRNTLRALQFRAYDSMNIAPNGQIIIPTGGGKTYIMIADCLRRLTTIADDRTIVVVAPRILLANQLCEEFIEVLGDKYINPALNVLHVHSGETDHLSTTKTDNVAQFVDTTPGHRIIFTTYSVYSSFLAIYTFCIYN